jgi:glycosyltransferase involved in cell wall biosynthesis
MCECEYGNFLMTVTTTTSDQSTTNKAPLIGSSAQNKLAVIFCAKNCEKTIGYAISSAKKSYFFRQGNGITIVIDGFSTDNTRQAAKEAGASIVMQQPSSKFPGKGMAMKTGLEAAIEAEVDAIIFLDADIKNLTPEWIDLLSEPVLSRGYDMARGYYNRHPRDAAVTKLVAKPMLSVFFPELTNVEQPLSGEVCASTKAWKALLNKTERPPDGWGIDVWFLIAAAMSGFKIDEVFLGKKDHSSFNEYKEDVGVLSKMAEQVLFTILKQAVNQGKFDQYQYVDT